MKIYRDFDLSEILYYKIGGIAQFVLEISNKEDLLEALDFVKKNKIKKVLPIGLGSNLLMSDKDFDGAVLWYSRYQSVPGKARYRTVSGKAKGSNIKLVGDDLVEVFAAESLDDLIQFSFANNLIGLEWAGGLPSTIGAAVRGNVGAFGGEIKDIANIVEIVKLLDDGYSIENLTKDQLEFGYRDSIIKRSKNLLVVSATFQLRKALREEVKRAREAYKGHIGYRNKNHPLEFPSCGSVFKNIVRREEVEKILRVWKDLKELSKNKWYNKVSTGYVINRLGFSGLRIGEAEVSKKHANYIVNIASAKFNDVISIIEKIKDKFYKTFGFHPELEVEVVK